MVRRSAALFLALTALTAAPAFAQNPSQADQDACTPDVFKLCQEYIPDEGPIVACLQSKHAQLSPACEPVIFPHTSTGPASTAPNSTPKRHKRHKRKSA